MPSRIEWQRQCYGCTEDELATRYEESRSVFGSDWPMLALSELSDAQEQIALGHAEGARQTINRAKWIIGTHLRPEGR